MNFFSRCLAWRQKAQISATPKAKRHPDTQSRNRVLVVFDDQYSLNGNIIFAATQGLVNQLSNQFDYHVFCRGKYTGPRFKRFSGIRVTGRKRALYAQGMRLRDRIARKLAKFNILENEERWIANIQADEQPLLRALFASDECHAIVLFAHDPSYALRIAKLAHVFSSQSIPHLVVVSSASRIPNDVVQNLRSLGARILRDGEPSDHDRGRPFESATTDVVTDTGVRGLAPVPDLGTVLASFDYQRALSFLDRDIYPHQAGGRNPAVVWEDWLSRDLPYRPRVRNVILFIRPDWMNCGSGTLFASLAQWFADNDGLLLDIAIWPYRVPFDIKTRDAQLSAEQRHIGGALYFSLRQSTSIPYLLSRVVTVIRYPPWTIANQTLIRYASAAMPSIMTAALRKAKITHIYLNHYFTYAYASPLIIGRKFYMDTHDIQSVNFVQNATHNMLKRRSDAFPALLADEMRVVRKAERLGFVNQDELELAANFIPRNKLQFIIPIPYLEPCRPRPMRTAPRLLIVASDNRSNQRNINWFLAEVWPIMLTQARAQGDADTPRFEVNICGSIADHLPTFPIPGINVLGIVEDMREQYESCDVVLLPVISGSGVGVKTIEAILYERPLVATFHALRGLPQHVVDAIGYVDDASMFARQVTSVLTTTSMHLLQAERSRRAAQALREEKFYVRLSRAMDSVRLDVARDIEAVSELLPASSLLSPVEHAPGE